MHFPTIIGGNPLSPGHQFLPLLPFTSTPHSSMPLINVAHHPVPFSNTAHHFKPIPNTPQQPMRFASIPQLMPPTNALESAAQWFNTVAPRNRPQLQLIENMERLLNNRQVISDATLQHFQQQPGESVEHHNEHSAVDYVSTLNDSIHLYYKMHYDILVSLYS